MLLRLGGAAAAAPGRAWSIFEQLQLEEALMRSDGRNWCIMNTGADPPTIVMGMSGVADKLIHREAAAAYVACALWLALLPATHAQSL